MTTESQAHLPSRFAEWETALVARFLMTAEDGDASPIHAFEVTPETLLSAFPEVEATPEEANACFQEAMRTDYFTWDSLAHGQHRASTKQLPNYFATLAMTLLVDTLLDGQYSGQGQYRDRLRTWLKTSRSLMQLSGIASMWRELASWLDKRVAEGQPFRQLVLPDPRTWRQIGHTRRLSFPTRADVRFLERVLASSRAGLSDPPGLIRAIGAAIDYHGASWGLEAAFEEFRDAFRRGYASTDHRFWRLVLRSARAIRPNADRQIVLELEFDEDGNRFFRLGPPGERSRRNPVADLGAAIRTPALQNSANLSAAKTRGILFFRQIGIATWCADSEFPTATLMHVGVSRTHISRAAGSLIDFEESGDWLLSLQPVRSATVEDLLQRLQLSRLKTERLVNVSVANGVRTGNGWLGRRPFLPRLDVESAQVVVRRLSAGTGGNLVVVDGAFAADAVVDGIYDVSLKSAADHDAAGWSRRLRFYPDALPHAEVSGAAYQEEPVREWTMTEAVETSFPQSLQLEWEEDESEFVDLLEAVYAAGRAGLSESELINLVARVTSGGLNPWAVLRSLQEAGFVDARSRARWRGRVWTLGAPCLRLIGSNSDVLLEGATCQSLQSEFRAVALGAGGRPFRHFGLSQWSVPVIGAAHVNLVELSRRLGLPLTETTCGPKLTAGGLETSAIIGEHHVLASSWDWDLGRFVTSDVRPDAVSLTRWVHPGGRDHDVYRVSSPNHVSAHATRNAAIVSAFLVAQKSLFEVSGDRLSTIAVEGALPLEIARWLRVAELAGGGPDDDGCYVYPLARVNPSRIDDALPGLLDGVSRAARNLRTPIGVEAILAARRSGGRVRAGWIAGEVEVLS